jgi:CRISPR-associated protein Csd1
MGLVAFRQFVVNWQPDRFDARPFMPEMLDANIMFRLEGDDCFLHDRPAAKRIVEGLVAQSDGKPIFCLVTGRRGAVARLHPKIKGVAGSQTSGASMVSFNLESFASYDKSQGENAPTSERGAFEYGSALNRLLERDGLNRVRGRIGDATVVFWADASRSTAAVAADEWFGHALSFDVDDATEAKKLSDDLEAVAQGRPLTSLRPAIEAGTRFHVLGLSPNAARVSVRYWLSDSLEVFAARLARHHELIALNPPPWRRPPAINYLLAKTAATGAKFENIPPGLAGEVLRAILSGLPYPWSWLSAAVMRLRAGDDAARGWHAAAIRAVLNSRRTQIATSDVEHSEVPMGLDREHRNVGYQLGRLFAVYEQAQRAALGRTIKSTIRDKYFGAASATPASIFPVIIRAGQNHLAKARKEYGGWAHLIERELEEIMGRITPRDPFSLPRSLRLEDQGEFAVGYYHQRSTRLGDATVQPAVLTENADETEGEGNDND